MGHRAPRHRAQVGTVTGFQGTAPRWWAPDLRTGVGRGDFVGLAGVRPGFPFATAEASLRPEQTQAPTGLHFSGPTGPGAAIVVTATAPALGGGPRALASSVAAFLSNKKDGVIFHEFCAFVFEALLST